MLKLKTLDPFKLIYVGVDIHRYEHTAYAADRFEEKLGTLTFPNTEEGISGFINWLRQLRRRKSQSRILIGVEDSGGNGALIASCLVSKDILTLEVNPVLTKSRRYHQTVPEKSDQIDARLITEVLIRRYLNLPRLSKEHIRPPQKELEEIVRHYGNLVREKTRLKNRLHRLFHQLDPQYRDKDRGRFTQANISWWRKKIEKAKGAKKPEEAEGTAEGAREPSPQSKTENRGIEDQGIISIRESITADHLNRLGEVTDLIKETKKAMEQLLGILETPLLSMPGVGVVSAARIHAQIRSINRFPNQASFRRYAGTAPLKHSSAGKGRSRPDLYGDRKLNRAIHQVALTHCRTVPESKKYYQKKLAEGKTKKQALRSLKNRLADIIYGVLKSGQPYQEDYSP